MKTGRLLFMLGAVVLVAVIICGCGLHRGKTVPFKFTFPPESDGTGWMRVRKLSVAKTESIHVYINIDANNNDILRTWGSVGHAPYEFQISPAQDDVKVWIETFPSKPDGFYWGHFMSPTNLTDRWNALSGNVSMSGSRIPDGDRRPVLLATVVISNVLFQSSNTLDRMTLDKLEFTNVHVGLSVL